MWEERRLKKQESERSVQVASLPASLETLPSSSSSLVSSSKISESTQLRFSKLSPSLKSIIDALPQNRSVIQEVYDGGSEVRGAQFVVRGKTGSELLRTTHNEPRTVVLLQDVHLNNEAQTNIAEILIDLISHQEVGLIGVEGAFTDFDFSRFAGVSEKLSRDVALKYLNQNKIAAHTFLGLTYKSRLPKIVGVDDVEAYSRNLQAYYDSQKIKTKITVRLAKEESLFSAEKQKTFSGSLLHFDDLRTAYHKNKISLGSYVKDLSDLNSGSISNELTIDQFLEALKMESSINFKKVDVERTQVLEKLAKVLSESEMSGLLNESLAYRLGKLSFGVYYQHLKNLCESKGISLKKTPSFDNYIRYVLLSDGIKADKLFESVERLETRIEQGLAKSDQEKELLHRSELFSLTQKLVEFSLTSKEWSRYSVLRRGEPVARPTALSHQENQNSFFQHQVAPHLGVRHMSGGRPYRENDLLVFEKFYEEADIRSEKMVEAVRRTQFVVRGKRNSELLRTTHNEPRTAVLITGGFHTSQIAQRLKEQNISYVIVSPKLTKIDEKSASAYLSIFSKEKSPLEKLFSGEKLFLSPAQVAMVESNQLNPTEVSHVLKEEISISGQIQNQVEQELSLPVSEKSIAVESKSKVHVLYLEDRQTEREVHEGVFRDLGYEVTSAENGVDALNKLKEGKDKFDLVVSDVDMPEMNGIEFYNELKKDFPSLAKKFIFFASTDEERVRYETGEAAISILLKPATIDQLQEKIESILGKDKNGDVSLVLGIWKKLFSQFKINFDEKNILVRSLLVPFVLEVWALPGLGQVLIPVFGPSLGIILSSLIFALAHGRQTGEQFAVRNLVAVFINLVTFNSVFIDPTQISQYTQQYFDAAALHGLWNLGPNQDYWLSIPKSKAAKVKKALRTLFRSKLSLKISDLNNLRTLNPELREWLTSFNRWVTHSQESSDVPGGIQVSGGSEDISEIKKNFGLKNFHTDSGVIYEFRPEWNEKFGYVLSIKPLGNGPEEDHFLIAKKDGDWLNEYPLEMPTEGLSVLSLVSGFGPFRINILSRPAGVASYGGSKNEKLIQVDLGKLPVTGMAVKPTVHNIKEGEKFYIDIDGDSLSEALKTIYVLSGEEKESDRKLLCVVEVKDRVFKSLRTFIRDPNDLEAYDIVRVYRNIVRRPGVVQNWLLGKEVIEKLKHFEDGVVAQDAENEDQDNTGEALKKNNKFSRFDWAKGEINFSDIRFILSESNQLKQHPELKLLRISVPHLIRLYLKLGSNRDSFHELMTALSINLVYDSRAILRRQIRRAEMQGHTEHINLNDRYLKKVLSDEMFRAFNTYIFRATSLIGAINIDLDLRGVVVMNQIFSLGKARSWDFEIFLMKMGVVRKVWAESGANLDVVVEAIGTFTRAEKKRLIQSRDSSSSLKNESIPSALNELSDLLKGNKDRTHLEYIEAEGLTVDRVRSLISRFHLNNQDISNVLDVLVEINPEISYYEKVDGGKIKKTHRLAFSEVLSIYFGLGRNEKRLEQFLSLIFSFAKSKEEMNPSLRFYMAEELANACLEVETREGDDFNWESFLQDATAILEIYRAKPNLFIEDIDQAIASTILYPSRSLGGLSKKDKEVLLNAKARISGSQLDSMIEDAILKIQEHDKAQSRNWKTTQKSRHILIGMEIFIEELESFQKRTGARVVPFASDVFWKIYDAYFKTGEDLFTLKRLVRSVVLEISTGQLKQTPLNLLKDKVREEMQRLFKYHSRQSSSIPLVSLADAFSKIEERATPPLITKSQAGKTLQSLIISFLLVLPLTNFAQDTLPLFEKPLTLNMQDQWWIPTFMPWVIGLCVGYLTYVSSSSIMAKFSDRNSFPQLKEAPIEQDVKIDVDSEKLNKLRMKIISEIAPLYEKGPQAPTVNEYEKWVLSHSHIVPIQKKKLLWFQTMKEGLSNVKDYFAQGNLMGLVDNFFMMLVLQVQPPLVSPQLENGQLVNVTYSPILRVYPTNILMTALGLFAFHPTHDLFFSVGGALTFFGFLFFLSRYKSSEGHELSHVYQTVLLEQIRRELNLPLTFDELTKIFTLSDFQRPVHKSPGLTHTPPDRERLEYIINDMFDVISRASKSQEASHFDGGDSGLSSNSELTANLGKVTAWLSSLSVGYFSRNPVLMQSPSSSFGLGEKFNQNEELLMLSELNRLSMDPQFIPALKSSLKAALKESKFHLDPRKADEMSQVLIATVLAQSSPRKESSTSQDKHILVFEKQNPNETTTQMKERLIAGLMSVGLNAQNIIVDVDGNSREIISDALNALRSAGFITNIEIVSDQKEKLTTLRSNGKARVLDMKYQLFSGATLIIASDSLRPEGISLFMSFEDLVPIDRLPNINQLIDAVRAALIAA